LKAILAGRRPAGTVPLDLEPLPAFTAMVLDRVRRIPHGRTMTYGEVAAAVGRPGAARAVGQALKRNPVPILIPCHRVVAATGPGGFSCGLKMKRILLSRETTPRP
jgi:methylated-DNA-[protein]-cysteine S-methyltransferase